MENESKAPVIAKKGAFPATVVEVINEYTLVINKGELHGIRDGQRVLLYAIDDNEIIDPDTGESLGYLEIVKGQGKVVNVQHKMSIVESSKVIQPNLFDSLLGGSFYKRFESVIATQGKSEIERLKQQIEGVNLPFENPQVGDKVKPI